jgi:hypothetical protein
MTLHVVALEARTLKNKYYSLTDAARQASYIEQWQLADHILKCCVDECQITRFKSDLVMPEASVLDCFEEILPDLNLLRRCLQFLRNLQTPGEKAASLPWWIKSASFDLALVEPNAVKRFVREAHECKFLELLLSSINCGSTVRDFIELGEFLELSANNECGVLAWSGEQEF